MVIPATPASHLLTPHIRLFAYPSGQVNAPLVRYATDVTRFRDPFGQDWLTSACADGTDTRVIDWIRSDPKIDALVDTFCLLARIHTGPPQNEPHLSISLHDRRGRWIAPAVGRILLTALADRDYDVTLTIDGLDKWPRTLTRKDVIPDVA